MSLASQPRRRWSGRNTAFAAALMMWTAAGASAQEEENGESSVPQDAAETADDAEEEEDLDATLDTPLDEPSERESPFKRSGAVPTTGASIKPVSANCRDVMGSRGFRDLPTILRGQYLISGHMPSDLMLRCDERTMDVGLRQDDVSERIKTASFISETDRKVRMMDAVFRAGGRSFRYGLQLEKTVAESSSTMKLTGAQTSKSTITADANTVRIDAAGRFGAFTGGLLVNHVSQQIKRETPVASQTVASTGERISLSQLGASLGWQRGHSQLVLARLQSAEEEANGEKLLLPWVTTVRYVQVLEPDQGVRAQLERVGSSGAGDNAHNRALLAYFLMIDHVTVDVAWFGRAASYPEAVNATADQLALFGFAASMLWQYSASTDFYGSLHSLSANDTLGGPEKRTGHKLVTGGNIGLQVAF